MAVRLASSLESVQIELLVPVPVASGQRGVQGRRSAVRAGTLLARKSVGIQGPSAIGGSGGVVPRSGPREARLPRGANTEVSENGSLLIASCDGEVRLRNMLVEVVPMSIHQGDLTAGDGPLRSRDPLFVTGSVHESARIEAEGEIYIQGDVQDAVIRSLGDNVTVMGAVRGSMQQPSLLRAWKDIICGPVQQSRVMAGGDIRLLAEVWHSTLAAAGNLYLPHSLEQTLTDVRLQIEGGVFPRLGPPGYPGEEPTERRHVRVPTRLRAFIAMHGSPPLVFRSCTILDLSAGGACCQLHGLDAAPTPGSLVQLKFSLTDGHEYILAIACAARMISPGVIGISFLQMTQRDQDLLTSYCLQLLLNRARGELARLTQRQDGERRP